MEPGGHLKVYFVQMSQKLFSVLGGKVYRIHYRLVKHKTELGTGKQ